MDVNLRSGAITKIMTGKCTENDLQPVVQAGFIAEDIFISNKLQKGSIVQLTKFQLTKFQLTNPDSTTTNEGEFISNSVILCFDLFVIQSKCGIIGHPELLLEFETPLVERATPTIEEPPTSKQKHDHVDSLLNEDIDDVEESPTSTQNPSTTTEKGSSHASTQDKKRKLQSTDDALSVFGKYMSDVMKMIVDKTLEDGLCPCYTKLGTLDEDVSKMTRMMVEKNKQDDVGACFKKLETLEQDISEMKKMMMEKNKEDDMGACIEKLEKMGWGAEEPIYDTALLLFLKGADYRKLWLHLKPECCGKWVKVAGSIFGLLD